jgi:DNA adenine methylase
MLENADTFYEGFLGSAAVTLDVALRYPAMKFVAADCDSTVAGFWELVGNGTEDQVQELLTLIAQPPTVELFRALREGGKQPGSMSLVERAYHAIFFNRTTFSGIAMAQPIGGFGQKSKWTIDCRYNAPLLQKNVRNLRLLLAGRLTVTCEDALVWLERIPAGVPLYLDPPYFVKGDMLYPVKMNEMQHGKLADLLATRSNWIMSYDICEEIRMKYSFAKFIEIGFRYSINGKKSNWKNTNEFLIVSP